MCDGKIKFFWFFRVGFQCWQKPNVYECAVGFSMVGNGWAIKCRALESRWFPREDSLLEAANSPKPTSALCFYSLCCST
jgi:hypothetical protein